MLRWVNSFPIRPTLRLTCRVALVAIVLVSLVLCTFGGGARAAQPSIVAESAILMDAGTGRILYSKLAHQRMYPASITKILTAVVALEHGSLDDVVKITPAAARIEGSKMHVLAGEEFTLEELLYGLLLVSGNDVAAAIATHIAGSIPPFSDLMNETAVRLGATNTHFTNPHGLPDTNHYTTAYDMAVITRYALSLPEFLTIVSTPVKEIPARPGRRARRLASGNWMLGQGGIDGVKTGYTRAAQHTYVASAEREGRRVIAVVLRTGPKPQKWRDAFTLIDYAYTTYRWHRVVASGQHVTTVPVVGGVVDEVAVETRGEVIVPILRGEEGSISTQTTLVDVLTAPVVPGADAGYLDVYVDTIDSDAPIARVDLVASADVAERIPSLWERFVLALKRIWERILGD